jgi:hypothetical protein
MSLGSSVIDSSKSALAPSRSLMRNLSRVRRRGTVRSQHSSTVSGLPSQGAGKDVLEGTPQVERLGLALLPLGTQAKRDRLLRERKAVLVVLRLQRLEGPKQDLVPRRRVLGQLGCGVRAEGVEVGRDERRRRQLGGSRLAFTHTHTGASNSSANRCGRVKETMEDGAGRTRRVSLASLSAAFLITLSSCSPASFSFPGATFLGGSNASSSVTAV